MNHLELSLSLLPVGYELIFLAYHGSRLYGTNTEHSDIDIKGVYLPPLSSVILTNYPKSFSLAPEKGRDEKNKAGDVEITLYSVQEFLKMCIEGETISIDMIHTNSENTLYCGATFEQLLDNRHRFYTKDMKAFLGYAKRQVNKYGMKGTRMAALKEVFDYVSTLTDVNDTTRMNNYVHHLPVNEFCYFVIKPEMTYYSVLDALYQPNMTVNEFKQLIIDKWNTYGERSRLAMENEGVDWKAVSHALRAAYQLIEIYEEGKVTYPLVQRDLIRAVKQGKVDFQTVSHLLDGHIQLVTALALASNYPRKVDKGFWDQYLLFLYNYTEED